MLTLKDHLSAFAQALVETTACVVGAAGILGAAVWVAFALAHL
jgi:hypothetical protein